jgi:hypothetical protein
MVVVGLHVKPAIFPAIWMFVFTEGPDGLQNGMVRRLSLRRVDLPSCDADKIGLARPNGTDVSPPTLQVSSPACARDDIPPGVRQNDSI